MKQNDAAKALVRERGLKVAASRSEHALARILYIPKQIKPGSAQ
jgi:hypothetical protein